MKLEIGTKVQLKQSQAKWYLDHLDIYFRPDGTFDDYYETETQLHLLCCLGEPVYGTIKGYGIDCYLVEWECGSYSTTYYIEKRDFTVSK